MSDDKNVKKIRNSPLREEILSALDLPVEELYLGRWKKTILVKAMPIGHPRYVAYIEGGGRGKGREQLTPREENIRRNIGAVIMSALDPETEEPIFNWSDADDLREKHWNTVLDISAKAFELAGGDSPVDRTAMECLQYLVAYASDNGWTFEDQEPLDQIRVKIEENLTLADDDDEVAGDPKGDPTPAA